MPTLQGDRSVNYDSSFGGRRAASTLVQISLSETRLDINPALPTLQGDRTTVLHELAQV